MFENGYFSHSQFHYAEGLYMILPIGLPDRFYSGKGEHITIGDDVICFKPDTPSEIIKKLVKEYTEHKNQIKESGVYID